jgi:holo-ACP synthase
MNVIGALLDAREERWLRRLTLSRQGTLLTLTLNIPGPDKGLPRWLKFYDVVRPDLQRALADKNFTFAHVFSQVTAAGPEDHFLLTAEASALKRAMVDFEERRPGGRLLDLDVMAYGRPLDREALGLPSRLCLCCSRPAKECAAAARHPLDEVLKAAERILEASLNIQAQGGGARSAKGGLTGPPETPYGSARNTRLERLPLPFQ